MPEVLFIDACPRGAESRTLRLAGAFLEALRAGQPEARVKPLCLNDLSLLPLDGTSLAMREALIAAGETEHSLFEPARLFRNADLIVVAAPYWDYMFPASLKTLIEHLCVRTVTFDYVNDRPVGYCRAEKLVYITTAGGYIGDNDWGYRYMSAVCGELLGISSFERISCEGLDIAGNDPEALLEEAGVRARALASGIIIA